ncbi:MAG: glycoside hydrolase family 92 protein, partial [Bacteroidetes bacterium]
LTNGYLGSFDFKDGQWLGYWGVDAEVILDLGQEMKVETIGANFLQQQDVWIFLPQKVTVAISKDGKEFQQTGSQDFPVKEDYESLCKSVDFEVNAKMRYIKIEAVNVGKCPEWHIGAGDNAWVFFDEIIVK